MTQISTLSNSLVEICDYLFKKMIDNKANLALADVYFGDQNTLPTTPIVCIEPGVMRNLLRRGGMARMIDIEFELSLLVYHSFITSPQENRRGADLLAEAIAAIIHEDKTLGVDRPLVIHGHCTEVQSGYTTKGNTLVRANRITYIAQSQFVLPS